jgi:hypothetical protein
MAVPVARLVPQPLHIRVHDLAERIPVAAQERVEARPHQLSIARRHGGIIPPVARAVDRILRRRLDVPSKVIAVHGRRGARVIVGTSMRNLVLCSWPRSGVFTSDGRRDRSPLRVRAKGPSRCGGRPSAPWRVASVWRPSRCRFRRSVSFRAREMPDECSLRATRTDARSARNDGVGGSSPPVGLGAIACK